jgi:hypothetical protein
VTKSLSAKDLMNRLEPAREKAIAGKSRVENRAAPERSVCLPLFVNGLRYRPLPSTLAAQFLLLSKWSFTPTHQHVDTELHLVASSAAPWTPCDDSPPFLDACVIEPTKMGLYLMNHGGRKARTMGAARRSRNQTLEVLQRGGSWQKRRIQNKTAPTPRNVPEDFYRQFGQHVCSKWL